MSANVIGHVVEFLEEKDPETLEPKVQLKVKVRNTLGEDRVFWVNGPSDLSDFFAADHVKVAP